MGSSRKSQRSLIAVMVVIGLALVAGGWWFGYGRYTNAPSLTQLTHENAVKEAGRLGFDVELGAGRYAEDIPKDTVVDQQPGPGNRIVKGGTITLVLSLGPERYPVPEVAGQAADFAKAQLSEHFVVEVEEGFSDSLPLNFVVSTDPPAGTQLPPSSKVKLVVVKGKYPVHVPGVVGKLLGEADQILRSNGFTEIEVQRRDDESKPRDTVLEQNPPEGHGLPTAEGTKVVIVVANGPPGPPMPSVLTVKCSDAINHLRGLGYNVNANGNPVEQFFWTVLAQDPQPGTPTQPGQTVTLQCG